MHRTAPLLLISALGMAVPSFGWGQSGPPLGWTTSLDGLYIYQGDADQEDGGSVSANRAFLRGTALYTDPVYSAGVSVSYWRYFYDFDIPGTEPWDNVTDFRISAPVRFQSGARSNVFVVPSLRWDYESGADRSGGMTYGVFAGVTWDVNDRLTIGPAFGAFSEIESNDVDLFLALLIDWEFADRWRFSTANAPGTTQGPGISLSYAASDALSLGVTARYESVRFKLDGDGVAPGGVGEDKSLPVALTLQYAPNPGTSLSAFVGAEFNGELALEDRNGNTVSLQDYDTAPIAGVSFRLAF